MLAAAEPVHGTPFHSWTCSCASVLMFLDSTPNSLWCAYLAIGLAVGAIAGCLVGVLLEAPRHFAHFADRPASVTSVSRLLVPLLAWLTLLLRGQTLVHGVPCLLITLLALAADCCELAPSPFACWASGPSRCGSSLSCLANSQEYPPRARRR